MGTIANECCDHIFAANIVGRPLRGVRVLRYSKSPTALEEQCKPIKVQ